MASLNSTQTITNHRNTSPPSVKSQYRIGVIDQKKFLILETDILIHYILCIFSKDEIDEIEHCEILPPPLFNNKSKISLELQHDKYRSSSSCCFSIYLDE